MTRLARRRQQPLPLLAMRWFFTAWLTTRRRGWLALALWLAYGAWTGVNFALAPPAGEWRVVTGLTLAPLVSLMTFLWAIRAMPAFAARRALRQRRSRCTHLGAVPVEAGGEVVSHLCLGCDAVLPADWTEPEPPEPRPLKQPPRTRIDGVPGGCPSCRMKLWCAPHCECGVCLRDRRYW